MEEWWTYTLADFLMFSPAVFFRQFELYNADIWPAHILTLGLALLLVVAILKQSIKGISAGLALTGLCWLWMAWGYFLVWYATINWAATYFAVAFAVQGLLLFYLALNRSWQIATRERLLLRSAPPTLLLIALAGFPIAGILFDRPFSQIEWFGLAPNPTVIGTLGLLAALYIPHRWIFLTLPLIWCLISGLTRWTLTAPDFWIMPAVGVVAIVVNVQTKGPGSRP